MLAFWAGMRFSVGATSDGGKLQFTLARAMKLSVLDQSYLIEQPPAVGRDPREHRARAFIYGSVTTATGCPSTTTATASWAHLKLC